MSTVEIFKLIGTFIGGGALFKIFDYFINNKKTDNDKDSSDRNQLVQEFKILLSERKEITDKLIETNSKLVVKLENRLVLLEKQLEDVKLSDFASKQELSTLRNQLLIFESSHVDIPLAMWMKDTEGKLIFINSIYEDIFLIPRGYTISDYLGKKDDAVWSKEVVKSFAKNDSAVMRTKKYVRTTEVINDVNGALYNIEVLKYPRKLNGKVIGISGIVLNYNIEIKDE